MTIETPTRSGFGPTRRHAWLLVVAVLGTIHCEGGGSFGNVLLKNCVVK